jgi:prepilin-type N-terminal cleavage/methylation domain-containing protein/prepilin-type processing-associated H-X9-DG protein
VISPDTKRPGFSLPETLVVIGIIGLLMALAMSAIAKARSSAQRVACLNSMKNIGVALTAFHGEHGRFPPSDDRRGKKPGNGLRLLGWMVQILPYIGEDPLWVVSREAALADDNPLNNPPHRGFATVVRQYVCAADWRLGQPLTDRYGVTAAYTSYIGSSGTSGTAIPFERGRHGVIGMYLGSRASEITDGLSNTIMFGERPPPDSLRAGWWYPGFLGVRDRWPQNVLAMTNNMLSLDPDGCNVSSGFAPGRLSNPCDCLHYWSLHGGGGNFIFADGSGRFLDYSARKWMVALASRDGGEPIDLP